MSKKFVPGNKLPKWLNSAVFYQIYPQSFYDSNEDGIGDIPGIIERLDYIRSLGVNAIWLNPVFCSPFNDAGYDISNFYKVAPRYGSNRDLKHLFQKAKKMGIRIVMDLVIGHTSNEHPWFKNSGRHKPGKYKDWYVWTDSIWHKAESGLVSISGSMPRDAQYVTNFFYSQPALNHGFYKPEKDKSWQQSMDHPGPIAVRREVIRIMKFWLKLGAAGFRCDLAHSLVKNDPEKKGTMKLWKYIKTQIKKEYPEAVLISEWGSPEMAIPAGFDIDFMLAGNHRSSGAATLCLFNCENLIENYYTDFKYSYFRKQGRGDISHFIHFWNSKIPGIKHKGYVSIPTGSHDKERFSTGRTLDEMKIAFTFLLTVPHVPFIYYGDEIGMKYIKELSSKEGGYYRSGSRTPMQWSIGKNAGFSQASSHSIYLPVDLGDPQRTVSRQEKDHNSLLNVIRKLIKIRNETPALQAQGDIDFVFAKKDKYPLVYLRKTKTEAYLIALNPSSTNEEARFKPARVIRQVTPVFTHGKVKLEHAGQNCTVSMSGVSCAVFSLC